MISNLAPLPGTCLELRDDDRSYLLELPQRTVTDFDGDVTRLEFHPDPILRQNPANRPRGRAVHRAAGVAAAQPQPEIPDFPHIPDIPMRDHGDFQRAVVDAPHAIWARVSQCRCVTRGSVRERSPSAAGPSRQPENDNEDDTDED